MEHAFDRQTDRQTDRAEIGKGEEGRETSGIAAAQQLSPTSESKPTAMETLIKWAFYKR